MKIPEICRLFTLCPEVDKTGKPEHHQNLIGTESSDIRSSGVHRMANARRTAGNYSPFTA
jgi:hypothetical protein